jgi:hypothetical protein
MTANLSRPVPVSTVDTVPRHPINLDFDTAMLAGPRRS